MLTPFKRIRKSQVTQNKLGKYLLYALGEIILVVVGILIAIQINDWNRERSLISEEKEIYDLLVTDLKRDSVLFETYKASYTLYLETFFVLNSIEKDKAYFKGIIPDFVVSNIEFNPVVQNNSLQIIEKLRSKSLRNRMNSYFRRLNQVAQATDEFNSLIERKSRPFFLEENDVFDNGAVFNYEDQTFPPFKGVSVIDTVRMSRALDRKEFTPILSELRMSMGFYLTILEQAIQENYGLIEELRVLSE